MGIVRLLLALSVVAGHAGGRVFGIKLYSLSASVDMFFIISGFYMAMILNEKYVDAEGNAHFYLNRFLRLYPTYLIGLAVALVVNLACHGDALNGALTNATAFGIVAFFVSNAAVVGQDLVYILCLPDQAAACSDPVRFALNPPAWSIAVEMVFYAMAPFLVRSLRRSLALWAVGLAYFLLLGAFSAQVFARGHGILRTGVDLSQLRFVFIPASFMFFGLGSVAYHVSRRVFAADWMPAIAVAAGVAAAMAILRPVSITWWYEATIFALCVPLLFHLTKSNAVDRFIGELSYPVYMLHWPLIIALRAMIPDGKWFATAVALVAMAAAALVHIFVERPIDRYRAMIALPRKAAVSAAKPPADRP